MSLAGLQPTSLGRSRRPGIVRRLLAGLDGIRQDWLKTTVMVGGVAIVGWLVLYPLAILFNMGLRDNAGALSFANYVAVFSERGLVAALVTSLETSALTTVFSLLIALPMAWGVARTTMPGKGLIRTFALIGFVMPNFITAIAWILLAGPNAGLLNVLIRDLFGIARAWSVYSLSGLVLVLTFSFYPLIFFATTAALESMDPSYEEAAQMSGASAWRASLGVSLPLVLPAIASSSVFVFLEAIGAFGAPAAIANAAHFHTLTTKIYELFSYPPRFELAAAAATPIIAFTFAGLALQRWMTGRRRYTMITGKVRRPHTVDIGWLRWVLFAFSMLVILASVALPLFVLVRNSIVARWGLPFTWQNFTLRNYAALLNPSTILPRAICDSLLVSTVTASVCVVLAIVIVWIVERTTVPGRGLITLVSTVTFAFPGVALALGFVLGYRTGVLALYGTLWLFFVAFTAHRFPFAFQFVRNSLKQLSGELEEAGRMVGASWTRTIVDISFPLLRSGLVAAWIMVFAVTLRELSMAILLNVNGTETLPIAIFNFVDNGTFEIASSTSVLLIVLSIASVAALRWATGKSAMEG